MEYNELYHWGTKGMRWGIRRYQNSDGSLTPAGKKRYNKEVEKLKAETAKVKAAEKVAANRKKTQDKIDKLEAKKQDLEARKKALKKGDTPEEKKTKGETPEETKERLLKSTDAKELYEHRDKFTYNELNDRVNRIDLENRLQSRIVQEHKVTGRERINNMMKNVTETTKNATSMYKSIDEAASTVANSFIGKTLAKQLGIELPKKEKKIFNLKKDNLDELTPEETAERAKYAKNRETIEKYLNKSSTNTTTTNNSVNMDDVQSMVDDAIEEYMRNKK